MNQASPSKEPDNEESARRWAWFRNRVLPWFGLSLGLILLIGGLWIFFSARRTTRHDLKVSAGSRTGLRTRFIDLLDKRLSPTTRSENKSRMEIHLIPIETAGSVDALAHIEAGDLDLAFIQGGIPTGEYRSVRQVATLHLEALHLLVKRTIYPEVEGHLASLKGKAINVSRQGSGTFLLSTRILRFAGLTENDYNQSTLGYDELIEQARAGEPMPDAIFLVSSLPSPVASVMVNEMDYRIVDLPFSASLRRTWLSDFARQSDSKADVAQALRRVDRFDIPAMTYRIDPPTPSQPLETIGTRMSLVASVNVPDEVVAKITQTVYETDFARATEQKLRWDELSELAEFPLHVGARTYLTGKQPIATQQVIEITEQLVGIFGALIGAWLFLWQWMRRMRMRRKDAEFVTCIDRVVKIENEALSYEDDADAPIEKLQEMQEELSEIKTTLIDRYRDGYLEGTEMLSAFLKHANDASELISRIILHKSP